PPLQHLCRRATRSPPQDRWLLPVRPASELSRSVTGDGGLGARFSQRYRSALNRSDVRAHHRADPCGRRFSRPRIRRTISRLPTKHPLATVPVHLLTPNLRLKIPKNSVFHDPQFFPP